MYKNYRDKDEIIYDNNNDDIHIIRKRSDAIRLDKLIQKKLSANTTTKTTANLLFAAREIESLLEDIVFYICNFDFSGFKFDDYDCSIILYEADNNAKLTPECQEYMWNLGFERCWVNHKDRSETYYSKSTSFGKENPFGTKKDL